jgi:hypothetical protein
MLRFGKGKTNQDEAVMKRLMASVVLALTCAYHAQAADKVKVPETAKLLNKAEIIAQYDGKLYSWDHPNTDKAHGTTTYVAASSTIGGTWESGKDKGEWEGRISWKGDQYCFETRGKGSKKKYNPKQCNMIYLDGITTYEVNPKTKQVLSVNNPM